MPAIQIDGLLPPPGGSISFGAGGLPEEPEREMDLPANTFRHVGHRLGVSDRPTARREVGARRARLRSRDGTVRIDAEGMVKAFDPVYARMLGFGDGQLEGTFFFAYLHGRDLTPLYKDVVKLLGGRLRSARWTFRFRAADGEWFRLSAHVEAAAAPSDDGLVLTFTGHA